MLYIEIRWSTFHLQGTRPTVPGEPGCIEPNAPALEDAWGQAAVETFAEASSTRMRAPRVQAACLSKVSRLSQHPFWGDAA